MFRFEIDPAFQLTYKSLLVILLAIALYIVVPIILATIEYRLAKKSEKQAKSLMLGTFASAILFGIFSVVVGIVLLIVFQMASSNNNKTGDIPEKE